MCHIHGEKQILVYHNPTGALPKAYPHHPSLREFSHANLLGSSFLVHQKPPVPLTVPPFPGSSRSMLHLSDEDDLLQAEGITGMHSLILSPLTITWFLGRQKYSGFISLKAFLPQKLPPGVSNLFFSLTLHLMCTGLYPWKMNQSVSIEQGESERTGSGESRAGVEPDHSASPSRGAESEQWTWTSVILQCGFLLNLQFTWGCVGILTGHVLEGLVNKCEQLYMLTLKDYPFLSRT